MVEMVGLSELFLSVSGWLEHLSGVVSLPLTNQHDADMERRTRTWTRTSTPSHGPRCPSLPFQPLRPARRLFWGECDGQCPRGISRNIKKSIISVSSFSLDLKTTTPSLLHLIHSSIMYAVNAARTIVARRSSVVLTSRGAVLLLPSWDKSLSTR